jgi:hypothetical protein
MLLLLYMIMILPKNQTRHQVIKNGSIDMVRQI